MKLSPTEKKDIATALRLFSQIGVSLAGCVLAGLFAGKWLDAKLGTQPVFIVLLTLLGTAAAVFGLYKMIMKTMNDK